MPELRRKLISERPGQRTQSRKVFVVEQESVVGLTLAFCCTRFGCPSAMKHDPEASHQALTMTRPAPASSNQLVRLRQAATVASAWLGDGRSRRSRADRD